MTIDKAIQKAIEGGWKSDQTYIAYGCYETFWGAGKEHWKYRPNTGVGIERIYLGTIFFDPLFWQALGKAMGWRNGSGGSSMLYRFHGDGQVTQEEKPFMNEWAIKWHRMIDHLAEGGKIESFFETL